MSKSGVFAHFGSREELQISVIREYHARFEDEVFYPALREPRGLPRLRALFDRWVRRVSVEIDSGCIYISGAVEFDDRPGPVRDALVGMVQTWQRRAATARSRRPIDEGHLRADTDAQQMLFEIHGLILALHHDARFLRTPGARRRARAPASSSILAARTPSPHRRRSRARRAQAALADRSTSHPFSTRSTIHAQLHPAPARHAVRDARSAQRRRRVQGAAARTPTSTPTPSTRCSRKAASSPPR